MFLGVGLPPDWSARPTAFVWPPGPQHASSSAPLPPMRGAPASLGLAAAAAADTDAVEPFGGVDAATRARVLALAAAPVEPTSAAEYLEAHQIQQVLDAALNALVHTQLPASPWEALAHLLPHDAMVPPPPTIPTQEVGVDLGFARLKEEFRWLHSLAEQ